MGELILKCVLGLKENTHGCHAFMPLDVWNIYIYLCISLLDPTNYNWKELSLYFPPLSASNICLINTLMDSYAFYHCVCEPSGLGLSAGAHSVLTPSFPAPLQCHLCLPESLLGLKPDIYEQPQQPSLCLPIQRSMSPEICPAGGRKHQRN